MPYITHDRREDCNPFSYDFCGQGQGPSTPGEFNFAVTTLIKEHLGKDPNYATINAAIGILECAKLELYRRVAAPYEDKKIEENGEVY